MMWQGEWMLYRMLMFFLCPVFFEQKNQKILKT